MRKRVIKESTFYWIGINAKQLYAKGKIVAFTQNEAIVKLRSNNIQVLTIHRSLHLHSNKLANKIAYSEVTLFTRQLATVLTSGIPLIQSLKMTTINLKNHTFKSVIFEIIASIESGHTLSVALRKYSYLYDSSYINLVAIGETTGKLEHVFERIADLREKNENLKRKIIKAMLYPCVIFLTALIVFIVMLTTIIPEFESLFSSMSVELPLITRYIISFSNWLSESLISLIFILFSFVIIIKLILYYSVQFQRQFSRWLLSLPIFGEILSATSLASFCYALSFNLTAGIPVLKALKQSTKNTNNLHYQMLLHSIYDDVSSGITLHSALRQQHYFPYYLIQMIMIGEQTGKLEEMLDRAAIHYENRADTLTDNINKLLEPFIMVFLGIVVGGLIISMYLPIFNLMTVLG